MFVRDERGESDGENAERGREKNQSMRRFSTHSRVCSMSSGDLEEKYFTADKCVCVCGGDMLCNILSGEKERQGSDLGRRRGEEDRRNVISETDVGETTFSRFLFVFFCCVYGMYDFQ